MRPRQRFSFRFSRPATTSHVVFTRRAASLPHHQGQVAFPGGTRRADDRDAEATALREADEEIGLRPGDVHILGRLDEIETVASRFRITPIVGLVPQPYVWTPCPREVDTVFTVPLATLRAPDAEREELWDFDGRQLPIRHFPVAGQVIWGATYRITRNLLDLVARIADAPSARGARLMRPALLGLGLVAAGVLAAVFAEPLAPTVEVTGLADTIGRGTPMRVTATDRGSGLAEVEVRLVPGDGSEPLVLARQEFPRRGIFGSGVHQTTLAPTLGANVPVPEGKATLEVRASDHSLFSMLRRWPRVTQQVLVDVTPPKVEVVDGGHDVRVGGSELVIARVGTDAVSSGIQVGDLFFSASSGVFKEPELRTILFAPRHRRGARRRSA